MVPYFSSRGVPVNETTIETTSRAEDPVRLFVGVSPEQRLALEVLAFSVRRRTARTVEVWPMDGQELPVPRDRRNRGRTGFSFARFEIPRLCGYQGTAVYLDADMLALGDVAQLWSLELGGADLLYSQHPPDQPGARFSVMLLDCSRLEGWSAAHVVDLLDQGQHTYEQIMHELVLVSDARKRAAIPTRWNSLDHFIDGETALVHYTSVPTQPWIHGGHPHGAVWYRELQEALDQGEISAAMVHDEIRCGHVHPRLLEWTRLGAVRAGRGR